MKIKKVGCILINKETKKIGLIYRKKQNDYSFLKGHQENIEYDMYGNIIGSSYNTT